jgi:hypothetical protein
MRGEVPVEVTASCQPESSKEVLEEMEHREAHEAEHPTPDLRHRDSCPPAFPWSSPQFRQESAAILSETPRDVWWAAQAAVN